MALSACSVLSSEKTQREASALEVVTAFENLIRHAEESHPVRYAALEIVNVGKLERVGVLSPFFSAVVDPTGLRQTAK